RRRIRAGGTRTPSPPTTPPEDPSNLRGRPPCGPDGKLLDWPRPPGPGERSHGIHGQGQADGRAGPAEDRRGPEEGQRVAAAAERGPERRRVPRGRVRQARPPDPA